MGDQKGKPLPAPEPAKKPPKAENDRRVYEARVRGMTWHQIREAVRMRRPGSADPDDLVPVYKSVSSVVDSFQREQKRVAASPYVDYRTMNIRRCDDLIARLWLDNPAKHAMKIDRIIRTQAVIAGLALGGSRTGDPFEDGRPGQRALPSKTYSSFATDSDVTDAAEILDVEYHDLEE